MDVVDERQALANERQAHANERQARKDVEQEMEIMVRSIMTRGRKYIKE